MSLFKFSHVKISALSVVVPKDEINIYDEAEYYDNSIKKIDRMRKMVGFYKRRVAKPDTTATDYAYQAAENLIKENNIEKNSIDALVCVMQSLDYAPPVNAYSVHNRLSLSDDCIATDINQGCAGWIFGLYMASQMIESHMHKRILLLNGDTPSVGIDKSDRNSAPIFGDGGVATLIEYSKEETPSYYNIETKSDGFEAIICPFSGNRFRLNMLDDDDFEVYKKLRKEKLMLPSEKEVYLLGGYMDGLAVFDFTINVVPQNINKLLDFAKIKKEEVPALCLHQANKQIVQQVGTIAGFDLDKVPYAAFENYGNNTMCSIPTAICLLDESISKKNLCCSGFGNGLICASAVLNLEDTKIDEIKTFKRPDYIKTREEYLEYWRTKIKGGDKN